MPEVGKVVLALSGRESGALYLVIYDDGKRCRIADGRHRMLRNPKKKNPKHLREIGVRLAPGQYATDRGLRRALQAIGHRNDDNQP